MCLAHPAAQSHTGRHGYEQAGRGLPYTGPVAKGSPASARNLKIDQASPGPATAGRTRECSTISRGIHDTQSVATGLPTSARERCLKLWKDRPSRPAGAGRAGRSAAPSRGTPHTQLVAKGNSNVGLGAARQDAENWFSWNIRLTTRKNQLRMTWHAARRRPGPKPVQELRGVHRPSTP
jgi:hypothetical protein